jgi:hypothetical protein
MNRLCTVLLLVLVADTNVLSGQGFWSGTVVKSENFDRDPGWEGFNNHVRPKKDLEVIQDFGFIAPDASETNQGAIGGKVARSSKPCYYAQGIAPKSLREKLSASGTFKLTASSGNSGIFFGWFNSKQPGGSGRPISSFGMDFDGEQGGARLALRMISKSNKSCGTFITPFIPGNYRPTPIRNDGTTYSWKMDYDPEANAGKGRFTFAIQGDSSPHEEFEGKAFSVDLPAGFKQEGATLERFGLMNALKAGGPMTIYFIELELDGKKVDFSTDPGWIGVDNRQHYREPNPVGAHDFGFNLETKFAGGSPGEMGGTFWRSSDYAYYADKVGKLTLAQPLEASGKVVLLVGAPDSDMFIGWFNSTNKAKPPTEAGNFLGVHVGGPTRAGHYFQPAYSTARGTRGGAKTGPVLVPAKACDWKLSYDPAAEQGRGAIELRLGEESVTAALKPGQKEEGATFDRFGVFTSNIGGQMVQIYFDDLKYTADATTPNR